MLVIVGSSASGKTKIVQELIKTYHMKKLVTYTTREKRIGEIEGKDYHFISREDFIQKIKNNFFIEYVEYNTYDITSPLPSPVTPVVRTSLSLPCV